MSIQSDVTTAEIMVRLVVPGSASLPLLADLRYATTDPYAVQIALRVAGDDRPEDTIDWSFARQLLTDGVMRPVGEGDVRVWPEPIEGAAGVRVELVSPSGQAVLEMLLTDVVEFLSATYTLVPTGCETDHLDIDAELAAFFA
jgi:hypothetical protein